MNAQTSVEMMGKMLNGIPLRGNYVTITVPKDLLKRLHQVNQEFGASYDEKVGIK
jgi:hypothetical protein